MIKNRKLTLEQRIARLENALKARRRCTRKFEDGPVNDDLLALAKELKARLKMKGAEPENVKCYNGEIVVTLDWDYFGFINFMVFPTAKGFHVESDEDDNEDFATLDRVAEYIADRDYEAAMDL
jgi:hypothetical protein